MLEIASAPADGDFVQGDGSRSRSETTASIACLTGHFYGHLDARQRTTFLSEARRVAPELVVVDASREHSAVAEKWSRRVLLDGSSWEVYKRYFDRATCCDEVGGR